ncbi:AvrD family protein [Streptomyces sp. SBT349]|uniref:AvrD family protein n=1 Tax=Streptomyces sp. SBT349 TaxID=1580539 RepID=UPI00066D4215|nr:AvrD family protein [Streptomyces sp. SBT349]
MPSLELASIDDFLGPRDSRFLGEGFKRVEHSLRHITVSPGAEGVGGIEATAHISIPGLWSRKGDESQKPHLSTIDLMLFGAQLTGLYAAHALGLPPDARFAVQSIDMKAGSSPDEDELAKFPVSGRLVAAEWDGEEGSTTVDCRIGSLSARVHARHSAGGAQVGTTRGYDGEDELPGPWNTAPYGIPHRARQQLLTAVSVTAEGTADPRASARVALASDREGTVPTDAPATMIDAFVAALQLGQVLLYALDGFERARSNTLWMRRTRITAGTAPAGREDEVTAALERPLLLPSPEGTWRTAKVIGSFHGVQARASVAHLLPASRPGDPLRTE